MNGWCFLRVFIRPEIKNDEQRTDEAQRFCNHQRNGEPKRIGIERMLPAPPQVSRAKKERDDARALEKQRSYPIIRYGRIWFPVFEFIEVKLFHTLNCR